MKNFTSTLFFLLILISSSITAQVNYTAKDQVTTYQEPFLFGSNFGYNPPWQDEDLANIAAGNPALGIDGAGVKSSRPTLPGWFMEEYGYDFRLNTYQHYDNLGLKDNVCIVGFPSEDQQDTSEPCSGIQSEMFANLYTDIWDGGANGTPYNDDNHYAAYLYKTVSMYKDYVKFWEIWNEPGFDYSGNCGWRQPGDPVCNWWDNDPDPCINKLRAPIQHYIRTLRISYDIIKTLDPDAYVIIAGVGFESFLDAILRNTDNPVDGSVTPEYPHRGGAYFDVMGFHSYPHFDGTMKYWDNALGMFVYERHSDKGASGVLRRQDAYQDLLTNYGYDGITYPKKEWIITEINGPRRQFQDFVGSEEYQRNFIIKGAVTCMKNGIRAMHVYNLAERAQYNEATGEFDLFGLYEKVKGTQPYNQIKTGEGVAYKTMSDLISGSTFNAARTTQLNLPSTVDGGAFEDADGNFTYILWAKTTQDQSEVASASYAFPGSLNINYLEERNWEYSNSFESSQVDPGNIQLTGEPAFFTESIFSTDNASGCAPLTVNFQEQFAGAATSYNWTFEGGVPATSTSANPNVMFQDEGTYEYTLEVLDAGGSIVATQTSYIVVKTPPVADFNFTLSGPIIVFDNSSSANALSYNWVFGDGNTSSEINPTHVYQNNGNYTVTLIANNDCGASTQTANITINTSSNFQLPFNANTTLTPYDGPFRAGTNFGYNPPWTDISLADIAAGNPLLNITGIGVKASRPTLPGTFVDEFGYEFNLPNYEHYDNLGMEENVCIIGFPGPTQRDQAFYCDGVQSEMFANMYSDIWDGGANGTPYNDDNYLAAYLYKVVTLYGDHIRFWEIWNEPGFDYTGNCGWREPGDPVCNWWDQNPDPCTNKLRAPVMHYVRILRISYEIIKTLQPDDYLVVAGVGFPSFLDAIMRNTDNPVDGSVTADYPFGAGAYFDVMGFHSYPHFDGTMRWWDTSINGFAYARHSDQAITGITTRQSQYQNILENYGYNGTTYPNKEWIITESNLPRKEFQDYIGNEDAQVNFIIKAVVTCYKQNIHQFHIYNLGEAETFNSATREFDLMGMYQKLIGTPEYSQTVNLEGISYKTVSDMLFGSEYDDAKTTAMNLPAGVDGGAFQDAAGNYTYVVWAQTTQDQSEVASGTYSFPASFNLSQVYMREWNFSETGNTQTISPNNIALTGRPIYLSESQNTLVQPTAIFFPDNSVGCAPLTVNMTDYSTADITTWDWSVVGPNGYTDSSTDQNPSFSFVNPGDYAVTLEAFNAAGSNTTTQTIHVDGGLTAGWTYVLNGSQITFTNTSVGGTKFAWDFDDGFGYTNVENPTYTYQTDGIYNIGLTVSNSCDTMVVTQLIEIGAGSGVPPVSDFTINLSQGCGPVDIDYINLSSDALNYMWTFPGGIPSTSTEANPTVTYSTPGVYSATLAASNSAGTTTFTQNNLITVLGIPIPSYTYDLANTPTLNFTNNTINGASYYWQFGDGNISSLENPVHTYSAAGAFDVTLTVSNGCGSASTTQIVNIDGANLPPTAAFAADNINGCAPFEINFMDNSVNATGWTWTFPGGTPSTSTDQNPSVTYDTPGTYDVTLEVSNANGTDMVSLTNYITMLSGPTSGYTYTVNDSLVTFTNTSSNAFNYSWSFGDGTYSTDENPSHIFGASGIYEVVLTAANGCGSSATTFMIPISTSGGNAPAASFNADVNSGCASLVVNFFDNSAGDPTSWNWSFPGGDPSTSTDQNPTVTYDNIGTYSVTLEASNAFGNNIATQTSYITVNGTPNAGFSSSLSMLTADFTNTTTNATSYSWDFGDGTTSTDPNPSHTYTSGGIYTVILTATNNCGWTNFTENIVFADLPSVAFTSDVTNGCGPLTVEFTDNSTVGVSSWNWSFPGGTPSTSTDQNPTVVYAAPGNYNVSLVASNTAGSGTSTQTSYIEVLAQPTSSFTASTNALMAMFNNTSTNATSYFWDFGDGTSTTGANPTQVYAADGTYTVTLTATNECGSVISTEEVTVVSLPSIGFTADGNNGCTPFEVNFTDQSSANVTSWSWSFPGGTPSTSTDANPSVIYDTPGTYNVTLVGSNAAGSNSLTQTSFINVGSVPDVSFGTNLSSLTASFNNTTTNGTSYSWTFGDGGTSSDENPSHTYAANGTYTVTLTAANGCGSISTTEMIEVMYDGAAPTVAFTSDINSGCSPFVVNFTDQSSADATGWMWTFPGGSPSTSTDQNPSVTYSTPGIYDVTLVASNPGGSNSAVQTSLIEVGDVPTASFTSSSNGNIVSLTNTSSNGTTYSWTFGDGNSSIEENPTHTYMMDGTYTITLVTTNDCGTETFTETISVTTAATVAFTGDVLSGCAPLTVNFTDQSSGTIDTWLWEIPGATPASSTDQNPSFTFDNAGAYDVTLTVTNATGSYPLTQNQLIVVGTTPLANFDVAQAGNVYSFTNNSTGATSYNWDFGDGNMSMDMNPTHTYMMDGTYTVTLTATNDCGSVTSTETVSVTSAPSVAFTGDVLSGCAPLTVNFTDQSTGTIDTWLWEIPGATPASSTDQNPNFTFDNAGTYNVTLTVTNTTGSYPLTQTSYIVVSADPIAAFDAMQSGSVYSFTNNSSNGTSYLWDFGDGSMTSTEMNPTHSFAMNGTYTVTLITTNACGSDTTMTELVVEAAPTAGFSADVTSGCAPLTVQFNNASLNATSWDWAFQGGDPATSTDENPTITYNTPGTYEVSLTAANSVGSDNVTISTFITVQAAPTANFAYSSDTTHIEFLNTSTDLGGNTTYMWTFGDGGTSTEEAPMHDYAAGGTYTVTLTVTNDCGTSTTEMVVVITTSTFEISFLEEFLLFPNPNDGQFTIILKGQPKDDLHINLINIIGQYIHKEEVDFSSGELTKNFNFENLPVGTYIVELKSDLEVTYRKVVIE